jgi:putative ABC transport system permease protein
VVVRTAADPLSLIGPIRQAVLSLDKDQPISYVKTMTQYLSASVAKPRFNFLMMSAFDALALALAMVGVYGVVSHAVARRTREIGIRMALGADRRDVLRLVARQGFLIAASGIAIGLGLAFATARLLSDQLPGVATTDPVSYAGMAALLASVAFVACLLPARKAASLDPLVALRRD